MTCPPDEPRPTRTASPLLLCILMVIIFSYSFNRRPPESKPHILFCSVRWGRGGPGVGVQVLPAGHPVQHHEAVHLHHGAAEASPLGQSREEVNTTSKGAENQTLVVVVETVIENTRRDTKEGKSSSSSPTF